MKFISARSLSALLLAAGLTTPAAAQTTPAPTDTARFYKHHLGLTASPVLDGLFKDNRSLPLGLFYQRQLAPTKVLRLRLLGLFSYADSANFLDSSPVGITDDYVEGPSYRRWQLQVFAGYGWQRRLSRRLALDYGLEAGLGYERRGFSAARTYPYPPGGFVTLYDTRITQSWQAQVRPFAGLSYRPTARLRLFAEMALPLTFTRQRYKRSVEDIFSIPNNAQNDLDERAHSHRLSLVWRPVQLVGASYAF